MTSREVRRERREAERKAKKLEFKRNNAAEAPRQPEPVPYSGPNLNRPRAVLPMDEDPEACPEFQAYCHRLQREMDAREMGSSHMGSEGHDEPLGFVSQKDQAHDDRAHQTPQSLSRRDTNRANAQHSTGPRTPAGKMASSRNSVKHGLASGELLVKGEDAAVFESLLADLLNEHAPADPTETLLVNQLAQAFWLLQRAIRFQNSCFVDDGSVNEKRLALFLRYATAHERAFYKALSTLMRLKKENRRTVTHRAAQKTTSGFVSHEHHAPSAYPGFVSQNGHPSSESPQQQPLRDAV